MHPASGGREQTVTKRTKVRFVTNRTSAEFTLAPNVRQSVSPRVMSGLPKPLFSRQQIKAGLDFAW